jgi:hypothetical protein
VRLGNLEIGAATGADFVPVTPDDAADLSIEPAALYIETGGTLVVDTRGGQSRTIGVSDFQVLPLAVVRVRATGTTATGIHAITVG